MHRVPVSGAHHYRAKCQHAQQLTSPLNRYSSFARAPVHSHARPLGLEWSCTLRAAPQQIARPAHCRGDMHPRPHRSMAPPSAASPTPSGGGGGGASPPVPASCPAAAPPSSPIASSPPAPLAPAPSAAVAPPARGAAPRSHPAASAAQRQGGSGVGAGRETHPSARRQLRATCAAPLGASAPPRARARRRHARAPCAGA